MQKIIYIKYSELTLKGRNRLDFIKQLYKNLKVAFQDFSLQIEYHYDYMIITNFNHDDIDEIKSLLKNIPGINSFAEASILEKNLKISKKIFKTIKKDIFQKKYRGVTKVSCGI